jgi:hypothetical protein
MIEITNKRAVDKAKRTKPFVRKHTDNSYIVTPRRISKQRRLVSFQITEGKRHADCRDYHTGEQCPAVENDLICYHIAAAALRGESNRRRKVARRQQVASQPQAVRVTTNSSQPSISRGGLPTWYDATRIRGIRI